MLVLAPQRDPRHAARIDPDLQIILHVAPPDASPASATLAAPGAAAKRPAAPPMRP
ncbi:hypothetical protein NHU_01340 [Rhodovulum sulfidophilum]|uniref:Uncharacterized protein n=1 Tax=Rhodovulum sulfidophilum TaxID=35806 RepID=A0A0D6B1B5_RHOSU|nr:hypothetical protein NHU_01340 [Rhodovulum sulfidophilum]